MNGQYNTYIGARYVPIVDGEWDNTKSYDPLVIVTYQGNSYTSKTYVPVGADITNTTYWINTGNYNAQVESYREEVERINNPVLTYNTVAELKQSSKLTNGDVVYTTGYYNSNDGGCFTGVVSTSSGDIELNNGLYVNIINPCNPLQFGALGDGVTDDTSAFNTLINKSGVNYIYIPNKTFLINGVDVPSKEMHIEGMGNHSVLLTNTTCFNFFVDGKTSYVLSFQWKLENLTFKNNGSSYSLLLNFETQTASQERGIWIRGCTFDGGNCLSCVHYAGLHVSDCNFINFETAYYTKYHVNAQFSACNFSNGGTAINIDGDSSNTGLTCGQIFTNCKMIGNELNITSKYADYVSFVGCLIDYSASTNVIQGTTGFSSLTNCYIGGVTGEDHNLLLASSCDISNCRFTATASTGASLVITSACTVTGCEFQNSYISISGAYIVITGCYFLTANAYAIDVAGAVYKCCLSNNTIQITAASPTVINNYASGLTLSGNQTVNNMYADQTIQDYIPASSLSATRSYPSTIPTKPKMMLSSNSNYYVSSFDSTGYVITRYSTDTTSAVAGGISVIM